MTNSLVQFSDGDNIYFNFGVDISGGAYELRLEPLSSNDPILYRVPVLGTVPVSSENGEITFLANQYVTYLTISGDTDTLGTWKAQAIAIINGNARPAIPVFYDVIESIAQQ